MTGFDDAWLRSYQAKRAAPPSLDPALVSAAISFTLPRPIPLLNELLRMHWSKRRKYQKALAAEVSALLPPLNRPPLERATVTITRYSVGVPDPDAVTPKSLLDVLLVRSTTHPAGLGVLVDNSPTT